MPVNMDLVSFEIELSLKVNVLIAIPLNVFSFIDIMHLSFKSKAKYDFWFGKLLVRY